MSSTPASNTVQLRRSRRGAVEKTNEALRNLNEELRSWQDAESESQEDELVVVKDEGRGKRKSRAQSVSDDDEDDLPRLRDSKKRPRVLEDSDAEYIGNDDGGDESGSDADHIEDDDGGNEVSSDGEDNVQMFYGDDGEEVDVDDPMNTGDQETGSIDPRFIYSMNDDRLGSPPSDTEITAEELEDRRDYLDQRMRRLLNSLKKFSELDPDSFTVGFRNLLKLGEDKLSNLVMTGIPGTTIEVLGKQRFTIEDILELPRLEDEVLAEKGVYLNILQQQGSRSTQLYVGSASGKSSILQRWHTYINGSSSSGRHLRAIREPTNKTNLRCLAHYGRLPLPWLLLLTEGLSCYSLVQLRSRKLYRKKE